MSAKATFWVWKIIENLNSTQKLVLLRLADHANEDGIAWPGKDSLARSCCMSKRTVDQAITHLEGLQLITIQKRISDSGKQGSNVYALNYHQTGLFTEGVQDLHRCKNNTGAENRKNGVQMSHGGGAKSSPESTNESIKESSNNASPENSGEGVTVEEYKSKKGRNVSGPVLARFRRFMDVFNWPKGQADAADAWLDLELAGVPRGHMEIICYGAAREAENRKNILEKGNTPIMAASWLAGRRYEDYLEQYRQIEAMAEKENVPVTRKSSAGNRSRSSKPSIVFNGESFTCQIKDSCDEIWWETWDGITSMASAYEITRHSTNDDKDLLNQLIIAMKDDGKEPPAGMLKKWGHMIK